MKLSHTSRIRAKSGMTLIELTVVILVLLSLLSVLFVGAKAWKKGSDRAANVLNLRNVQQAMRGHAAMNDIIQADTAAAIAGGTVRHVDIFGAANDGVGGYLRFPANIQTAVYTTPTPVAGQINTATGVLYLNVSATGAAVASPTGTQTDYGPKPGSTIDW